jgi:hypothetical protein
MLKYQIFRTISSIFSVRQDLGGPTIKDDDLECIGSLRDELHILLDGTFDSEPIPAFVGVKVSSGSHQCTGFYGLSVMVIIIARGCTGCSVLRHQVDASGH